MFSHELNTIIVFAARYSHHRKTGASLAVVDFIIENWNSIDDMTKKQLLREAQEASTNLCDWEQFAKSVK